MRVLISIRGNKQKEEYFKKIPGSIGAGSKAVAEVTKILKENGAKVGVVGACWGYKVAATSEAGKDFDAIAGIHPS